MRNKSNNRLNKYKDIDKSNSEDMLIGRNPVMEAIKAKRAINKIFISKGERKGSINEIIMLAREKHIVVQEVDGGYLNQRANGENHQGIIAYVSPFAYAGLEEILRKAEMKYENAFVVIADGITDPHNLGAIIRTAEALGAHGLVIPKRHSVPITASTAKASAGAVEYLPVARETNIVRCIEYLKNKGLWVIGADMEGKTPIYNIDLKVPIVLVIGGEDKGIGRLIKENCDAIARIPMKGKISSLNASVAGAVMMYEAAKQRGSC